jgi:hypothetical protein
MSQSSVIAAALLIGFIVYVTVRGQLAQYLGVLGIGADAVNAPATTGTVTNPGTVSIGNFGLGTGVIGATDGLTTSTGVAPVAPIGTIPGASPSLNSTTIGSMQPLPTAPVVPTSPNLTLNDGTDLTQYL